MSVLHEVNEILKIFCPYLVAGVAVLILYWTSGQRFSTFKVRETFFCDFIAVTYGAITVLQVMGYENGIRLLERTQPYALIVGLPSIPVALILSQFFRWDDFLSNALLKFVAKDQNRDRQ